MIKDSGERTQFDTGAVRDMHTGKGRMDLLPWEALVEVSKHCEEGALKYGERNCEKGIPIHSLIDSAFRHLAKYMMGMKDEPHLRAACWNDITGGVDFMGNVSAQVAEYKDTLDQKTLLSILKGVFAMPTTDAKNKEFVEKHSTTIYAPMSATTLNSAVNKACGANKQKFSLVFMHSDVATNLENMKLLEFMKQTDGDGIQKDLTLATWNGRTVVVDDDLPAVTGYADAEADTPGALVIKASGASGASEIDLAKATPYFGTRTLAADMYVVPATQYTTFIMGNGAISYEDIGAKVPYEMARDPKTNGGVDTLYMRQRKVFSPYGISYEKKSQTKLSPTDTDLENGQNWTLVHSGESTASQRTYINHKAIPIARIQSLG